jgi:short-subunit dehydrogenase
MKDVGGRTALVTGASRGIGPYIARTLFDHGMKVVIAARSAGDLAGVQKGFDPRQVRSLVVRADVAVEADRQALVEAALERFGAVDVLVNNAGLEGPEPFVDHDLDSIRELFEVNVLALMRLTQMVLPTMLARGSGHVVNIASLAGLTPVPYNVVYSTSKHAVVGFSESLRYELDGTGVGVSAVCPGFIRDAGMFTRYATDSDAGISGTSSPEEVARAVYSAIVNDRARVVVSPLISRSAPFVRALSPGLIFQTMKSGGVLKGLKATAERNRDARLSRAPGAAPEPPRRRRRKPQ